jgi:hypothetical protein
MYSVSKFNLCYIQHNLPFRCDENDRETFYKDVVYYELFEVDSGKHTCIKNHAEGVINVSFFGNCSLIINFFYYIVY